MEIIRLHIKFHGSVQGVGFRYRASHAASLCCVGGYVRNCPDGTVEMELEGTQNAIDQCIILIEQGHYIHITNMDVKKLPLQNETSFTIR